MRLFEPNINLKRDGCTQAQIQARIAASIAAKRKAASERFAPVLRIVEQFRSLNWGYREIAKELNSLGYYPPNADRWKDYILVQALKRHYDRSNKVTRES